MNILVLDVGTTSMRGILYDPHGVVMGTEEVLTPLVYTGEWIEQKPEVFTEGVTRIVRALSAQAEIGAITLTAFRSAPALVDGSGNALTNFIMWQDTRTRSICQALSDHNDAVYRKTGSRINPVFTASKITWWNANRPELVARAHKMMVVPDYIIHYMTGEFITDYTYGSRTSLMDIGTHTWDADMCGLFGVDPRLLCTLVPQGAVCGQVNRRFSEAAGVARGTPVISAGGDQQCGALGLGELDERSLVLNCGTGAYITALSREPYLKNPNTVCNVAAVPEHYVIESSLLTGASALNWVVREFFPELWHDGNADFGRFNEIAASVPPLANGLYCVPHFQGCGPRDWNAASRATFTGFSLNSHRADLARAIYEGMAAEIVKSMHTLPESTLNVERIYMGGGLSKSALFDQILSDMTGREIACWSDSQATALGAWCSAAVATGLFEDHGSALASARQGASLHTYAPDPENHGKYRGYIERTEKIYRGVLA